MSPVSGKPCYDHATSHVSACRATCGAYDQVAYCLCFVCLTTGQASHSLLYSMGMNIVTFCFRLSSAESELLSDPELLSRSLRSDDKSSASPPTVGSIGMAGLAAAPFEVSVAPGIWKCADRWLRHCFVRWPSCPQILHAPLFWPPTAPWDRARDSRAW